MKKYSIKVLSPHILSSPHIVPSPPIVPNPPTAPSSPNEPKFWCAFCGATLIDVHPDHNTIPSIVRHIIDVHPELANSWCAECCDAEYTYNEVALGKCECQWI